MTAVDLLLTVLVLGVIVIAGTVVVGALAGGAREGRAVGGRVDEGSAAPLGEAHRLMPRPGSAVDVPSGTRRADRSAFSPLHCDDRYVRFECEGPGHSLRRVAGKSQYSTKSALRVPATAERPPRQLSA